MRDSPTASVAGRIALWDRRLNHRDAGVALEELQHGDRVGGVAERLVEVEVHLEALWHDRAHLQAMGGRVIQIESYKIH